MEGFELRGALVGSAVGMGVGANEDGLVGCEDGCRIEERDV